MVLIFNYYFFDEDSPLFKSKIPIIRTMTGTTKVVNPLPLSKSFGIDTNGPIKRIIPKIIFTAFIFVVFNYCQLCK